MIRNNKSILIAMLLAAAVLVLNIIYVEKFSTNKGNQTSSLDIDGFFEQLISTETYKLDPVHDSKLLAAIFGKYCSERGLDILFKNRVALKNRNIFDNNEIRTYGSLNVELLKETSEENKVSKDYKVSYRYTDINGSNYDLVDIYTISIEENKIDYIKLDTNKSIH